MAVSMTPVAVNRVKELMTTQKVENAFLRMGVRGGGCSGMTYDLQFDNELRKHDKQFEVDGVKVVVDVKSYLYLNGTTLDYVTQGLTGGLHLRQPQREVELRLRHVVHGLSLSRRGRGKRHPDLTRGGAGQRL